MKLSKTVWRIVLVLMFCATSVYPVSAVEPDQVDAKLAKLAEKIGKTEVPATDYDKLQAENDELLKYLESVCVLPEIMASPLKKAMNAGLDVITSDDKKLRCYSWDTRTGGTMHFYYSLIAYDAGSSHIKSLVLNPENNQKNGDPGSAFESADSIKTNDGKTVYLVRDQSIGSTIIHGRTIQAYTISNGKLVKCPFFKTPKQLLDNISYAFNEDSDKTEIHLSDDKKTLRIPLIKPETDGYSGGITTG